MEPEERFIQVFTTFENRSDAEDVLRHLVLERLAACVQLIGPIHSTYHWQGKVESSEEWLGLIKTSQALYAEVETEIKKRHPYTCPEILAVPVVAANPDYLQWMRQELKRRDE